MPVSFVRTRTYYQPYDDLFHLAALSDFPVIYLDEMDAADPTQTYIFAPLNGEITGWPDAKARIIFQQMEWHTDHSRVALPPGVTECWNFDRWHAELIGAKFVPLGSHECLNPEPRAVAEKTYDVAFMAYTDVYRRKRIKDQLEEAGLSIAPNAWGDERHKILLQSRCVLHVHQWENIPAIAALRWCIAAAYHLPIISETVRDRAPFGYSEFMTCEYDSLVEFVVMHLRDQARNWFDNYGHSLHAKLCRELTFRKSIECAL